MPDNSKIADIKTEVISARLPVHLVEAMRDESARTGVKLRHLVATALANRLNVKLVPIVRRRKA